MIQKGIWIYKLLLDSVCSNLIELSLKVIEKETLDPK